MPFFVQYVIFLKKVEIKFGALLICLYLCNRQFV